MKRDDKTIIVETTLRKEYRAGGCAAHLVPLGLTAYGETMEEAEHNLKALFNRFINQYRQLGVLGDRLTNHFQVDWWPADEYDGELEVEDTTPQMLALPTQESASTSGDSETTVALKEAA